MSSNRLILCRPLLLLPSIFPNIRVFSDDSVLCIRWPKYWSSSFSISPSNEYSGLISFTMDWLDLPAVQGTLNSLLQHHRSKASILQCSAFFIVQLPDLYMTTAKIIALTRQNFVGNVMLQHSKNEDHGIQSHHFMANRWGYNGNSERLFSLAPKSLQMVTAAMKLKDTCSLEEKL